MARISPDNIFLGLALKWWGEICTSIDAAAARDAAHWDTEHTRHIYRGKDHAQFVYVNQPQFLYLRKDQFYGEMSSGNCKLYDVYLAKRRRVRR